jgi:hypothetical protein
MKSDDLRDMGFVCFGSVGELRSRAKQGVYVVIRAQSDMPELLPPISARGSSGGRWIGDSDILYIGASTRPLPIRIWELIAHGLRLVTNHAGGQEIWRIPDIDSAVVWCLESDEPGRLERELVQRFKREHGERRPFGNLQDPPMP